MKTYLELEDKLGAQTQLQPYTSTSSPNKNSLPQETLVPKKAEKKRAKAPVKRSFKVRVIVQPMPTNQTLPINLTLSTDPTPTAVTTTVTLAQTPVAKQQLQSPNLYLQLYTIWLKVNSRKSPIQ